MTAKPPSPIAPLVKGLFEEGAAQLPPSVVNTLCNPKWSDLQPSEGGAIAHPNAIDTAILKGHPFVVRPFMGRYSPVWALGLGKVHVVDPTDGNAADVPRWWEADVQAAQSDFVAKLAAEYDEQIPLIYIGNGGTIYAEPFIRGIGKMPDGSASPTIRNLLDAGYTAAQDQASYVAGYQMFRRFKVARLAQAFNPWQYVDDSGHAAVDVDFTIEMMDHFAGVFPRRAVWGNNSIRSGGLGPVYDTMYEHMRVVHNATGRAIRFQTATKPRVGDYVRTLEWALTFGAHAVELSPGFQDCGTRPCLSAAQLAHFDAALRAVAG